MAENPLTRAKSVLLQSGMVSLVVLDRHARVVAAEGRLVALWSAGEAIAERLFIFAGMEPLIEAMAKGEGTVAPLDLPAVFLGGNHEDGEPGVSLRLMPMEPGFAMLVIRPLEAEAERGQIAVQQHNDLELLRSQLDHATSQTGLNSAAHDVLFDTLRWGFRAPLTVLVQATEGTPSLHLLARDALDAVDDWLALLELRAQIEMTEAGTAENILALWSIAAELSPLLPNEIELTSATLEQIGNRARGSSALLSAGLRGLIRAFPSGDVSLALSVEGDALHCTLSSNGATLEPETSHRLELARCATLMLQGTLDIKSTKAVLRVPLRSD